MYVAPEIVANTAMGFSAATIVELSKDGILEEALLMSPAKLRRAGKPAGHRRRNRRGPLVVWRGREREEPLS
jgi:hypothetical protein